MNLVTAQRLLQQSLKLIKVHPSIQVVLLVGSWAKGAQREDSDLDLLFLSPSPHDFRTAGWHRVFKEPIAQWTDAPYGAVWSRHLQFASGARLEASFGHTSWLSLPLDAGTLSVLQTAYQVLHDPKQLTHTLSTLGLRPSQGPLWPSSMRSTDL